MSEGNWRSLAVAAPPADTMDFLRQPKLAKKKKKTVAIIHWIRINPRQQEGRELEYG